MRDFPTMGRDYWMELRHVVVCFAVVGFGGTLGLNAFVPLDGWLSLLGIAFGGAAIVAAAIWDSIVYERRFRRRNSRLLDLTAADPFTPPAFGVTPPRFPTEP